MGARLPMAVHGLCSLVLLTHPLHACMRPSTKLLTAELRHQWYYSRGCSTRCPAHSPQPRTRGKAKPGTFPPHLHHSVLQPRRNAQLARLHTQHPARPHRRRQLRLTQPVPVRQALERCGCGDRQWVPPVGWAMGGSKGMGVSRAAGRHTRARANGAGACAGAQLGAHR